MTLTVAHSLLMLKEGLYNLLVIPLCSNHKRSPATGVPPSHSSRCLLASATSPRAAARMRAVSPSEEGLFTVGSALASILLRLADPSSDISCLVVISPQSRIVPMIHAPATAARPRVPSTTPTLQSDCAAYVPIRARTSAAPPRPACGGPEAQRGSLSFWPCPEAKVGLEVSTGGSSAPCFAG